MADFCPAQNIDRPRQSRGRKAVEPTELGAGISEVVHLKTHAHVNE